MNSLSNFEIPDGLEVRVWAQSPQMLNPTNIDVDARGRIWATEAVNYRETQKPQHALQHPDGDRVMILEDTDGDGVADSSKVFVQDKDLTAPLGIAVIGNKVIVSCSPNLIVYTDEDGDDKPDKKEVLLKGFGGYDHDHGLHAVTGFLVRPRSFSTSRGSTSTTRSTSSCVENIPRLKRSEFWVRCVGSPMARSTCDGSRVPDEQADPVDTAIPSRSSAISRLSASTRSKLMLVVLATR